MNKKPEQVIPDQFIVVTDSSDNNLSEILQKRGIQIFDGGNENSNKDTSMKNRMVYIDLKIAVAYHWGNDRNKYTQLQKDGQEIPQLSFKEMVEALHQQEIKDIAFITSFESKRPHPIDDIPRGRRTEKVGFTAVQKDPQSIVVLSEESISDRILEQALTKSGDLLAHLSTHFYESGRFNNLPDRLYDLALQSGENVLPYIPENKKTLDRCKIAVEKNWYVLNSVPKEFLDDNFVNWAIDKHKDRFSLLHDVRSILEKLPDKKFSVQISQILYNNFNRSLEQMTKGEIPHDYTRFPSYWHTPELNRKLVASEPGGFGFLYEKEKTPDLCLYAKKLYPDLYEDKIRIPKNVQNGQNIFSFHIELEKLTGREFSYEDTVDIYNGRPVKFINKDQSGKVIGEKLKVWNKEKHSFSTLNNKFRKEISSNKKIKRRP